MFGRSRKVYFDPYRRRRTRRLPRWLLLLGGGVVAGAAAVVAVQQRLLPPRLSAAESAQLRSTFEQADGQRRQLADEVATLRQQLEAALAERRELGAQLGATRAEHTRLRDDLSTVIDALPADPRGGEVEIRAAQFSAEGGRLGYELVLSRAGGASRPMPGVLRLVVAGDAGRGEAPTVTLEPIALTLGRQQVLRGSLALPEGFRPRQATVRVLDRDGGKALGMRVLRVP